MNTLEKLKKELNINTVVKLEESKSNLKVSLFNQEGKNIFSETFDKKACLHCGHNKFSANQCVRVNIVVDSDGQFLSNREENMENAVYDSEDPYGSFSCLNCDIDYEDITETHKFQTNLRELLKDYLK